MKICLLLILLHYYYSIHFNQKIFKLQKGSVEYSRYRYNFRNPSDLIIPYSRDAIIRYLILIFSLNTTYKRTNEFNFVRKEILLIINCPNIFKKQHEYGSYYSILGSGITWLSHGKTTSHNNSHLAEEIIITLEVAFLRCPHGSKITHDSFIWLILISFSGSHIYILSISVCE